MKKIIYSFILFACCIALVQINISATDFNILSEDGTPVTDTICQNENYTLTNLDDSSYKYVYILDENRQVLDIIPSTMSEVNFTIPDSENYINIASIDYVDEKYDYGSLTSSNQLTVEDCGFTEENDSDYPENRLLAQVTYQNEELNFEKPSSEYENYQIIYQHLDDYNSKNLNFTENENSISVKENDVIQIEETYTLNDKKIENFYEINILKDNYIIRNVSGFDVKNIKFDNFFNLKLLGIFLILIIMYIIFNRRRKKYKKKYRKIYNQRRSRK